MSNNDSFFNDDNSDRTIVRPRPGGQRRKVPRQTPPASMEQGTYNPAPVGGSIKGINPILDAAASLLLIAGQLRDTVSHPDPEGLRNQVARELTNFENQARKKDVNSEQLFTARYLLCTFLDEIVLRTPWGTQSAWSNQTLLSKFHSETGGGEKFFQILERLQQEPARNVELLELIFVCIALGFLGKYQVQAGGQASVDDIQLQLMQTIRLQRGDFERDLSPPWRSEEIRRNPLARYVPLWVVGAVGGLLLFVLLFGFRLNLSSRSELVIEELHNIGRNAPRLTATAPLSPLTTDSRTRLEQMLIREIKQGLFYISRSEGNMSLVVPGDGLFVPGQANVADSRRPLIEKIALALSEVRGQVLVTGHTDSDPIRGSLRLKYQSNWDLSQQRAQAVVALLAQHIDSDSRLIAEGLADTEPLVSNDTAANKARNRRIEITLLSSGR